jgi:predicted Zn-dependent protease
MRRDGQNVVSFGPLPRGILAATCTRHRRNRIVEADIRINSRYDRALKRANCSNQELLEPTVTHEVGHVYGLGHVSDKRHPRLTMSTRSDGACSDAASSLGLGDILGLERLY